MPFGSTLAPVEHCAKFVARAHARRSSGRMRRSVGSAAPFTASSRFECPTGRGFNPSRVRSLWLSCMACVHRRVSSVWKKNESEMEMSSAPFFT